MPRVEARSRGVEWLLTAVDALKWIQVDAMMFKNVSTHRKVSSNQMQVPKCCSCTNIMSRLATDCFAAAGRLQYTSLRTG